MFWSTLGRMIVVPVAFILAALTTTFVLLSIGYERIVQASAGASGMGNLESIFDLLSHGALIASGLTVLPALALVIVGEVARIRQPLFYIIGGGVALAAIPLLARFAQQASPAAVQSAVWQIFATAGFAGGFVYWLLAGRKA